MKALRVAVIHYWLVGMRGGERVLENILDLYPQADIFTHAYVPEAVSDKIRERNVYTTFINKLPFSAKHYQKYLPFMPMALENLDLRGYDLVISSEAGPAKGVICAPDALHVCYCHSPMRYIWDHYHEYRSQTGFLNKALMPPLSHYLRGWDSTTAARVDSVVANSQFIKRRIAKSWGRDATVIYPPVQTSIFKPTEDISARYLWVGQMTPYKRAGLVVDAFNKLGLPLLMVGHGELSKDIQKRAGPNIEIVERLPFDELRAAYAQCRALIFPPEEDFGIVPVEANAAGRPVIAYGRGGATETIVDHQTGLFFKEQTAEALIDAVERMEKWLPGFSPNDAVNNAKRFDSSVFNRQFSDHVNGMIGYSRFDHQAVADAAVSHQSFKAAQ